VHWLIRSHQNTSHLTRAYLSSRHYNRVSEVLQPPPCMCGPADIMEADAEPIRVLQDVTKLCAALEGNTTLRELSASGHAMAPESAALVATMLSRNSGLISLGVGDANFGDAGLAALVPGLTATATLQRLDLEAKGMTAAGAGALGAALAAGNGSLTHLNFSRNGIGGDGAAALAPGLLSLRSLDLSGCGIASDAGAAALSQLLQSGQLTSLSLRGNGLGPEGGSRLAAGVAASPMLQELLLADTALGDAGAAAIADALPESSALSRLDVSGCGVAGPGLEAICRAVSRGVRLQALAAGGNGLDSGSLAAAVRLLQPDGSLTELDLAENSGCTNEAALAALAGLKPLRKLSLFACGLGAAGGSDVAAQLRAGGWPALRHLDLGGNGIDTKPARELLDAIADGGGPAFQVPK